MGLDVAEVPEAPRELKMKLFFPLPHCRLESSLLPVALMLCEFGEPSPMEPRKMTPCWILPCAYGILPGSGKSDGNP